MGAIFGYAGFEDNALLKDMSKKLSHRAIDGFRYYKDTDVSLGQGVTRIGKDSCTSPITNEDGTICIIFDGRLFNKENNSTFLKSRGHKLKTDFSGEAALHLYEDYGMNFLDYINGDFAFCIYDSKKNTIILCTDNSGSRPLYYYSRGKELVFASDIRPILEYELIEKKLDKYALDQFLTYFLLPTENTLFTSIKKVMPSTYIIFGDGINGTAKYSEIKESIDYSKNEDYFIKKIRQEIERAVGNRVFDDVPVHVSLGGLDSGLVTGVLSSKTNDLNTYSLAFEDDKDGMALPKSISQMHNTNHHEIYADENDIKKFYTKILPHFNFPSVMHMDATTKSSIFLNIKGKRHIYFSGEGGDSVFGSTKDRQMILDKRFLNSHFLVKKSLNSLAEYANKMIYVSNDLLSLSNKANNKIPYFSKITIDKNLPSIEKIYANMTQSLCFETHSISKGKLTDTFYIYKKYLNDSNFSFLNRLRKMDIELESFLNQVPKDETLCAFRGMINNSPLLDERIIQLSFKIPLRYKFSLNSNKILLAKATKDLFPGSKPPKKSDFGTASWRFYGNYFKDNISAILDLFDNCELYKNFSKKFLYNAIESIKPAENDYWKLRKSVNKVNVLLCLGLWYMNYFHNEKIEKYL